MADCVCESNGFSGSASGLKAVAVMSGPGTLRGWHLFNENTVFVFLQLFDVKDDSKVNPGTTVPILSIGIPAGGGAAILAERLRDFSNGIVVVATTTRAGNVAPALPVDFNFFF